MNSSGITTSEVLILQLLAADKFPNNIYYLLL